MDEEDCDDCDWDRDDYYDEDEEPDEDEGCPCGYYCMDCLGMSWRDFM